MHAKILLISSLLIGISGCASQVSLPNNASITTTDSLGSAYIDKIDFSYISRGTHKFSKAKLCVAKNLTNNTVMLQDSSGSFVGAYTGRYYETNKTQSVTGGDIFKYSDDETSTLLAVGTTSFVGDALGIIKEFVKFEVELAIKDKNVTLIFSNITRAQQDTGTLGNNGFNPVGVWYGAKAPDVYASIELVANNIKTCIN